MKFTKPPSLAEGFANLGWDESLTLALGLLEISCAIVYVIPCTAVLGAILLTGYLGGETSAHVRIHDQFVAPIILGVLVWGGLWVLDARLRALLPLRI